MAALNRSIEEEAADESLPLPERMSSLLVSAGNDLAFSRYPSALEKFGLVFQYHGAMNSHALAAVARGHGLGAQAAVSVEAALATALRLGAGRVVICGSLYLAGEVLGASPETCPV